MVIGNHSVRYKNSNETWKHQNDAVFVDLGLHQIESISPHFALFSEMGEVVILEFKIEDDILLPYLDKEIRNFITKFNDTFELGEFVHGPGDLRNYDLHIIQEDDFTVSILANDKIQEIAPCHLSRIRRRQCDERMNEIEIKSFVSKNASI